jgi:hypothetical protein
LFKKDHSAFELVENPKYHAIPMFPEAGIKVRMGLGFPESGTKIKEGVKKVNE